MLFDRTLLRGTALARRTHALLLASASLALLAGCAKTVKPKPDEPKPLHNVSSVEVGGENVVTLRRTLAPNTTAPEFVSATVLPGRGFNLFQITANIPGQGEVSLLASPSLEDAASLLVGGAGDEYGVKSFSFGGAFLIPYPNRIIGTLTPDGKSVVTHWHGQTLTLPADFSGPNAGARKEAIHGLILDSKIEQIKTTNTADGQTVTGILHAGNFGGHWLSNTDLAFSVALSGSVVQATITATNIGSVAEPMAIGWHPYFSILSHDRAQARLHIPAAKYAPVNNYNDEIPTGKLLPVAGTPYDFTAPEGKALGTQSLDDNFSSLERSGGVAGVKLSDPEAKYGIEEEAVSPQIQTLQVYAPPAKNFVAIEPQFNYVDPFGPEWHGMNTGTVTLAPGKSVTWQVRLRLFVPPPAPDSTPLAK